MSGGVNDEERKDLDFLVNEDTAVGSITYLFQQRFNHSLDRFII